jgi:cytochrome P450
LFSRHGAGGLNLPPGPWPLPVIGNLHYLLGALPHHAMRALAQRYGPVMQLRLGHVPTVVVSSPEAAREVLKTHDAVFANRPLYASMDIFTYGGRNISFAPYGSRHWKEVWRLCATELLGPKRVLSFRPVREEAAASLVRSVSVAAAASPAVVVNVSERVKVLMNDILMRCAIGDTCPMREQYIQELDKGLELMAGFNLVDLFPGSRLARALGAGSLRAVTEVHHRIHHIMQAIIQHHANNGGGDGGGAGRERREDILAVLLRLQKDGDCGGGLGTILTPEVLSGALFVSPTHITRSTQSKFLF